MGNDFHNDFFWKIVVKIFVVCEGLKCDMEAVTCANSSASLIFNVINVTTIFINILHLVVLISLQSLKDKSYKVLLVSLCFLDIWVNLAFLLGTNCSLRTFLDTSAPLPTLWNLILCIMLESGACAMCEVCRTLLIYL